MNALERLGLWTIRKNGQTWIEPILQHIARNISPMTDLEIDDSKFTGTDKAVPRIFASGYVQYEV